MAQNKVIMIVDDEADLLEALKETLELEGYSVFAFDRVDSALHFLNQDDNKSKVNLIVSDMRMPNKNGLDLAMTIRHDFKMTTPFVMISGFADITPQQLEEAKIFDFISKPFTLNSFLNRINSLLK